MTEEQITKLDILRYRRSQISYELEGMKRAEELIQEDGKYTARIFDGRDRLIISRRVSFDYVRRAFNQTKGNLQAELEQIDKEIEEL